MFKLTVFIPSLQQKQLCKTETLNSIVYAIGLLRHGTHGKTVQREFYTNIIADHLLSVILKLLVDQFYGFYFTI